MRFEATDASIVIIARDHNPSILNPDFLQRPDNAIVPEDWKLAEPPVSAFPLARVAYDNGLTITAEPAKLTFQEADGKLLPDHAYFAICALKYVRALPHVNYVAVGCNFGFHALTETVQTAAQAILERFIKQAAWINLGKPEGFLADVKFSFPNRDTKLGITANVGELVSPEKKVPALRLAANFHRDIPGRDKGLLEKAINSWKADYQELLSLTAKLFGASDAICPS